MFVLLLFILFAKCCCSKIFFGISLRVVCKIAERMFFFSVWFFYGQRCCLMLLWFFSKEKNSVSLYRIGRNVFFSSANICYNKFCQTNCFVSVCYSNCCIHWCWLFGLVVCVILLYFGLRKIFLLCFFFYYRMFVAQGFFT